MKTLRTIILWFGLGAAASLLAADSPPLDPHLAPLQPFLEKTWKGTFKNSKPDDPTVDVMRWERALNGKAVRILHSINNGVYGGETMIRWDEPAQAVVYYYFTTAGFMTQGTMNFRDGKVITHEVVIGSANGITAVRGSSGLEPDGTFQVRTEHQKGGEWLPGHEASYKEDKSATVVFR